MLFVGVWARAATVIPTDLRCEYLAGPVGLDVSQPRLSWKLTAASPSLRGVRQRAYQILVASSPELLAEDQGDVWDSGKISTDNSLNIPFGGKPLVSRQELFWKVRVWDGNRKRTAWSEPARWEMGLLKPGDWQARWIDARATTPKAILGEVEILQAIYEAENGEGAWDVTDIVAGMLKDNSLAVPVRNAVFCGDPATNQIKRLLVSYTIDGEEHEAIAAENTTFTILERDETINYLRKDFTLNQPISKARLYATALGLYELHLNGGLATICLLPTGRTTASASGIKFMMSLPWFNREATRWRVWWATDGIAVILAMAGSKPGARSRPCLPNWR